MRCCINVPRDLSKHSIPAKTLANVATSRGDPTAVGQPASRVIEQDVPRRRYAEPAAFDGFSIDPDEEGGYSGKVVKKSTAPSEFSQFLVINHDGMSGDPIAEPFQQVC